MDRVQRAATAAAAPPAERAPEREADAAAGAREAGGGRISQADREAAQTFGPMIADWVAFNYEGASRRNPALMLARTASATGSGFGLALAEWLERWASEALQP